MGIAMDTALGTGDRMGIATTTMGTAMGTGDRMGLTTAGTVGNDGMFYSARVCPENVARGASLYDLP
jgi:hypothetical protein